MRLDFDDRHSGGIYRREYFLDLGRYQDACWRDDLDELAAKASRASRKPATSDR